MINKCLQGEHGTQQNREKNTNNLEKHGKTKHPGKQKKNWESEEKNLRNKNNLGRKNRPGRKKTKLGKKTWEMKTSLGKKHGKPTCKTNKPGKTKAAREN